jgi:sulfur relay (sulfurtransferase) DsrF/TusC family protein
MLVGDQQSEHVACQTYEELQNILNQYGIMAWFCTRYLYQSAIIDLIVTDCVAPNVTYR